MTIEIINGNLLLAEEKYIVHICNCISKRAAYLAFDIFKKFPYADIYCGRTNPDQLGNIIIRGNGKDQRYIVALLAQFFPGNVRYPNSNLDGTKVRQKAFHKTLMKLAKVPDLESVAMPVGIGCGAAGGNWEYYLGAIQNFANYIGETQGAKVVLYDNS